jgi:hypothetical protein
MGHFFGKTFGVDAESGVGRMNILLLEKTE